MYVCVCPSVRLYVCLYVSFCLKTCLPACLSVSLFVCCLSVCQSVFQDVSVIAKLYHYTPYNSTFKLTLATPQCVKTRSPISVLTRLPISHFTRNTSGVSCVCCQHAKDLPGSRVEYVTCSSLHHYNLSRNKDTAVRQESYDVYRSCAFQFL